MRAQCLSDPHKHWRSMSLALTPSRWWLFAALILQAGGDRFDPGYVSIAQLISNQLHRGVYAYDVGTYSSPYGVATDPYADGFGRQGPSTLPDYLVPAGTPRHKPNPIELTPAH